MLVRRQSQSAPALPPRGSHLEPRRGVDRAALEMKTLTAAQQAQEPHSFLEPHSEPGCHRWSDFGMQGTGRTERLFLSPWSGSPVSAPTHLPSLARIPMAAPPSSRTPTKAHVGPVPCIPTSTHHRSLPPLAMGPAASSGLLATRHPAVSLLTTSGLFQLGLSLSWGVTPPTGGRWKQSRGVEPACLAPMLGLLPASTFGARALAVATFS